MEKREDERRAAPGEEAQQAFPVGKLVVARVLSVTTKDKGAETDGANENSTPVLRLSLKGSRVQGDAAKEAVFQVF